MIIYAIYLDDEPKYIGLTRRDLARRWAQHRCAAKYSHLPLYKAMRKYGPERFRIDPIISVLKADDIGQVEIDAIAQYSTHINSGTGYNVSIGGENSLNTENRARGEDSPSSKLTEEFVRYIRDPEVIDVVNDELVEVALTQFGISVSRDCIRDARRGDTWRHVNVQPVKRGQGRQNPKGILRRSEIGRASFNRPDVRAKTLASVRRSLTGKPRPEKCKLTPCQVWHIYYGKEPANALAKLYGVDKATALNIRHKRILQYNEYLGV